MEQCFFLIEFIVESEGMLLMMMMMTLPRAMMRTKLMKKLILVMTSRTWIKVRILGATTGWRLTLPFLNPRKGKVYLEMWFIKCWRQV
jgi:hypothetical protein